MALYCYFTFPTTYFALRAEDLLKEKPFAVKMVPVPRSISPSCGTALRCSCGAVEAIKEIFAEFALETEGVYEVEEKELPLKRILQKRSPQ